MIVAHGQIDQLDRLAVVDTLRREARGGRIPAEDGRAAGEEAAEEGGAAGDGFEGGVGLDGDEAAVLVALDPLGGPAGDDAADGGRAGDDGGGGGGAEGVDHRAQQRRDGCGEEEGEGEGQKGGWECHCEGGGSEREQRGVPGSAIFFIERERERQSTRGMTGV